MCTPLASNDRFSLVIITSLKRNKMCDILNLSAEFMLLVCKTEMHISTNKHMCSVCFVSLSNALCFIQVSTCLEVLEIVYY